VPVAPAAAPRADAPAPLAVPAPADPAAGRQTYQQACAFCHDKGVAGAPKLGDTAAWSARTAQGKETLYASALRGKGAMPAKGGNPSLSDDAVKAAVDFLVAGSR
jgi:Cytochrome c5